ncbi:MAG: sigma-54-dependent Fis family transcriptional regulator [Planctomycetaceae bacterium]|nr:sigma-54-dependent Fis family transcriptional regulator [Planctomycetaceae bacterium]
MAGWLSSMLGTAFQVLPAEAAEERAEERIDRSLCCDVLILDYDHRPVRSEEWYGALGQSGPPVVMLAAERSRSQGMGLGELGQHTFVRTPISGPEIKAAIRSAFHRRFDGEEPGIPVRQPECPTSLDQLIGASVQMQSVYKLIHKVANVEASVLVTGESGTGKELIALATHNVGNRSRRPFVAVSCGAIPDSLIEAELFGHERGAFTGTVGSRQGYLEQAGDGTLFLDEIGELKLQTQVKLLRVLQQKEFSRLGSSKPIPLRARIVLATNRDLAQMVAAGEFREDLFYRINVINISAPALRQHPADIPQLAQHLMRRYSESFRKPVDSIAPDAIALLQSHSWPGNVRELGNVIQHGVIMAEGYSIQIADLPDSFQELGGNGYEDDLPAGSFERLLRGYKVKLANDAIAQCMGNKTLAAQSLSISRSYLHRLVRPPGELADAEGSSLAGLHMTAPAC